MRQNRLLPYLTLIAFACLCLSSQAGMPNLALNVVYSFTNGQSPNAGLVIGKNGSLYGTTATGGAGTNNYGGIFEVTSAGALVTNLWLNGADGAAPLAPLLQDARGNFYGTASSGGVKNNGTIFKLTSGLQFAWVVDFNNTNGSTPMAPLLLGTNGYIYGTTYSGGSNNLGTIFAIDSSGTLSNVYSFGGSDGTGPAAGLIQGTNGDLYGTTEYGGANGLGTVFELTYAGTLSNLCSFSDTTGAFPGGLIQDAKSNFYGSTISGGADFAGTIFKITTSNTILTPFTFDINNGASPNSPLLLGKDGNLYGTTEQGGVFGQGTIFLLDTRSNMIDFVSFNGADGALPRSGVIQGPDGNFYGTTSSGPNGNGEIYQLTGFPPIIITPPKSQPYASNHTAIFSVTAGGSAPLSYQWQFDGANDIPDATNASLIVANERLTNSGTYTVIVSNAYGATNAAAVLSVPAPTVKIISPPAGSRTNNVAANGTAAAFAGVAEVDYWITNINAGNLPSMTTNSGVASLGVSGKTTNWTIVGAPFLPGTNYITVQSVDTLSNKSAFATREFFYKVTALFALSSNGPGSVTGNASVSGDMRPTNGAMLNVGEGYTLTAHPSNNYVLSNWVSSTFTNNSPTLHFIMESNLAITANFSTNLFIGAAGTYNGLFYPSNDVIEQTAGMLYNLALRPNGTYTATLLLGGASYFIASNFDTSGVASNKVNRPPVKGGPVSIDMTLNWTNGEIIGSVSGSNSAAWVSRLDAEKSAVSSNSSEYTVLLAPGYNVTGQIPPGFGYMLITNHKGSVTLSGALADGSTFSQTVPLGVLGDAPVFYNKLYSGAGLLLGWLSLSNGAFEAETPIAWIKPAAKSGIDTNGFTNYLQATGSGWTAPPAKTSAVSLTNGTLIISSTSLTLDMAVSITNDTVVKVSNNAPTNTLTGTIAPKTGLLTITFGNGAGKSTTTGYGAMLQDTASGAGYFVTKTNAGAIILGP